MFLKKRWSVLLLKHRRQTAKFRFVEQIQGRTSIRVIPVCTLCETEHPGHLNVRGVLRRCVPNKELYPLRRFAAILLRQKAWLSSWHAFCIFYCLMAPCESLREIYLQIFSKKCLTLLPRCGSIYKHQTECLISRSGAAW